jgi:TolB-like protein
MKNTFIIIFLVSQFFTGCFLQSTSKQQINTQKTDNQLHNNLNSIISDISIQLFKTINKVFLQDNIVITSFVLLDDLKTTSKFGRLLGESMINELHTKGFKVIDFRGRNTILVNKKGEFYITRDTEKLKNEIDNTNILVGTYSPFSQNDILVNVRIMNFSTGEILSSARAIYRISDCNMIQTCTKSTQIQILEDK